MLLIYAGADTASEFSRQRDKIISAMLTIDADVYGLMEIENDGFGATSAIQDLVNGLNAGAGAGTFALVDPGLSQVGDDEITVGLIYKPASVTLIGSTRVLTDPTFTDPNNLGSQQNRPALAQTFQEQATGETFTVVVNHLKSKGASCGAGDDDLTTGQGNCNDTRTKAAQALATWLQTDPTGSGDPDFLIIGDLNAYAQENPIQALETAGYTNLIAQYGGSGAYSYIFDGLSGYLDHALVNVSLAAQVTGATEWHINADEPAVIDYNEDFNPAGYYSATPYRASDHDPVVVGLDLGPISPDVTLAKAVTPSSAAPGQTITYTLTFSNAGSGTASSVVITEAVPVSLTNISVISAGAALTDTGAASGYVWQVQDLTANAGGVITLTGQISSNLSSSSRFTNTATIAAAGDTTGANNTGEAGVTVNQAESKWLYLPIIISKTSP